MQNYIVRRLLLLIPIVLGVITLVFLIIHLIPGDPVEIMLGETAQQADKERLREELGLNKPLSTQYVEFLSGVMQGDIGRSIHSKQPVVGTIIEKFPATIELTIAAIIVALCISLPAGIIAATRQYSIFDNLSMVAAMIGISVPNFWLGPMLIIIFSITLGWLPVSGRGGLEHLILPALTLGSALSGILARMIRSSLLETLKENYITTARAKGLREYTVVTKHALSNALLPVVTILGLQFGALLSGSVITETIFSWPGIGRLTIQSIIKRDYPLVQGCVLTIALSYVLINLVVDILYTFLDPRITYD